VRGIKTGEILPEIMFQRGGKSAAGILEEVIMKDNMTHLANQCLCKS
jgi:hypothetical protein